MSLKTRLRISIVALVTIIVVGLSALYLYDFTSIAFDAADKRTDLVGSQVKAFVLLRIDSTLNERHFQPASLTELKEAWTNVVRSDALIPKMLRSLVAAADIVVEIHITGEDGAVLASSAPLENMTLSPPDRDFQAVVQRNAFVNLLRLMTRREDYIKTVGLGVKGEPTPVFNIVVVVRSTLLDSAMRVVLRKLGIAFASALGVAILLAFLLPTLVLNPLE